MHKYPLWSAEKKALASIIPPVALLIPTVALLIPTVASLINF
jgi:hypothetical protein